MAEPELRIYKRAELKELVDSLPSGELLERARRVYNELRRADKFGDAWEIVNGDPAMFIVRDITNMDGIPTDVCIDVLHKDLGKLLFRSRDMAEMIERIVKEDRRGDAVLSRETLNEAKKLLDLAGWEILS